MQSSLHPNWNEQPGFQGNGSCCLPHSKFKFAWNLPDKRLISSICFTCVSFCLQPFVLSNSENDSYVEIARKEPSISKREALGKYIPPLRSSAASHRRRRHPIRRWPSTVRDSPGTSAPCLVRRSERSRSARQDRMGPYRRNGARSSAIRDKRRDGSRRFRTTRTWELAVFPAACP